MLPYKTLYIYEIQGSFPQPKKVFSKDFIGCWYEADYSFLFFSSSKEKEVQSRTALFSGLTYCSETVLDYKNWETGREFSSFSVGQFFLYPFWEEVSVPQDLIPLKLNPGVVFGSGCHGTTQKCLEGLNHIYQSYSPQTVLDLGCGTGILSIAAAKLGAKQVIAIDSNNLAIETARENVMLNQVDDIIKVIEDNALDWVNRPAGLVIANIDFSTITNLLDIPEIYDKDWYIFSGMIGTQVETIKEKLTNTPIKIIKTTQENFWFTLIGKSAPCTKKFKQ